MGNEKGNPYRVKILSINNRPLARSLSKSTFQSDFICVHLWFQILKKGLRARGLMTNPQNSFPIPYSLLPTPQQSARASVKNSDLTKQPKAGAKQSGNKLSRAPKIFCPIASPLQNAYLMIFVKHFYLTDALGAAS